MLDLPLRTPRTTIRLFQIEDVPAFAAYRRDPEVARHQFWELPYTDQIARAAIAHQIESGPPTPGRGSQLAVEHDGVLAGDLFVLIDAAGTTATIGYTFASAHQGKGLATEATAALVDALFAAGVHRITATVDPDNVPSGMLLERLGFRYEARALQASFVRGGWVDDDVYALLGAERAAWREQSRTPPEDVRFVELDADLAWRASKVLTMHHQERFVAPVARSYRDALFEGPIDPAYPGKSGRLVAVQPWMRGVMADDDMVAFVMLAWPTEPEQEPYLWRLLVDRWYQGRGIGARSIRLVQQAVEPLGARSLLTSWVPGRGGPEPFYLRLGFEPTGDVDDGEIVARLRW